MLRIIGGKLKHRKLEQPPIAITRATKDIAKEGLFNSLGDISNKTFLDCFSGSGNIGIEAYSRGSIVTLIEQNNQAYKTILLNLNNLKINDIKVYHGDFYEVINNLKTAFDYIFIDPPYAYKIDLDFILDLFKKNIINEQSVIIIERDTSLESPLLDVFDYKLLKYSKTLIYILRSKK